ncbi:hypothetical protein PVAP13_1NG094100 [Panicum virgatum]|uniref:Uncharacterized protein n=1 Tax=Panicum virgatum TaxID=38727 RepID=A0A8T0WJX3_PANVG|nr:hypothetical protein PVAP13_1NG094100 [Panicum virgatum]
MQILWSNMILRLILGWLWCLIHMAISLFDLWSCLSKKLECYLISSELLSKYQILHLERLKCLGVVVDSREAKNVMEIKQLLHWFSTVGIKYVVLYDIEGVIKESIEHGIEASRDESTSNFSDVCANTKSSHCSHGGMVIECLSGSDAKEGIAKAANLLYSASCKGCNNYAPYTRGCDKMFTVFTEADMASALRTVGSGGPELDLLLVYGPVRCHLGFPSWRLRYTEIIHKISIFVAQAYGTTEINEIQFHCESLVPVRTKTSKLWFVTVDTNVKEDRFVVQKTTHSFQN